MCFFCTMQTLATVPLFGPVGTSRAFPQRIAGTLVGQEHAPTEKSRPPRPLWSFAEFRGPPVLGYASHWVWGPHRHPAVTFGGPYWHWVCVGVHVFFVLGQCYRLATIAIDPLFVDYATYNGLKQMHQPAKPHRHKQHPITRHHGRGPPQVHFSFVAKHIPQEGPLSPSPLCVHPTFEL